MKSTAFNALVTLALLAILNTSVAAQDNKPTAPDKAVDSTKLKAKAPVQDTPYVRAMKLGIMAWRSGSYNIAEASFLRALAEAEKTGKEDKNFSATLAYLTTTYRAEGKIQDAEKTQIRCVELTKKLYRVDDPEIARQEKSLALVYLHEKKPELAKPLLEHALAVLKKAGPRYQVAYGRTLNTQISMELQMKDNKAAENTALTVSDLAKKFPHNASQNYIWCITTPALVYYVEGKNKEAEHSLNSVLKTPVPDDNVKKALPVAIAMLSSTFGDFAYGKEQFKKLEAEDKKKPEITEIGKFIYLKEAELAGAQANVAEAKKFYKLASPEDPGKKPPNKPKRIARNMFAQQAETLYSIAVLDPLPAMYKKATLSDDTLYGKNAIEGLSTLMEYESYLRSIGDTKSADDCKAKIENLRKSNKHPVITTQSSKSLD